MARYLVSAMLVLQVAAAPRALAIDEGTEPTPAAEAAEPEQVEQAVPVPQMVTYRPIWDAIANCESGGRWNINTGNGFYGGLQFDLASWHAAGGVGYPHQAPKLEQIRVAENWLHATGWRSWPACSRRLGLR